MFAFFVIKQYERAVVFRLGKVEGPARGPGLIFVAPFDHHEGQRQSDPESMQRAMARQAEAEREKRAKIIAAEGEALAAGELAVASDVMMAHPLALQLRNLQTLVEVAVDKNSTVVFPAPLMSTIAELGAFLQRESKAASELPTTPDLPTQSTNGEVGGLTAAANQPDRSDP